MTIRAILLIVAFCFSIAMNLAFALQTPEPCLCEPPPEWDAVLSCKGGVHVLMRER